MARFLLVYRRQNNALDNVSPEGMQLRHQKWHEWIRQGLQKGWLLEPGDALTQEGRVIRAPKVVTDGPFIESKEFVGGFSIVEAETFEDAVELAASCPVLQFGASVEVRCFAGFTNQSGTILPSAD
jgi:hypothetical protein